MKDEWSESDEIYDPDFPNDREYQPGRFALSGFAERIRFSTSCAANASACERCTTERFDSTATRWAWQASDIPLGARIFAVADALDGMTSDRPYRKARPYAAAREEITRQSGRQFDPAVIKAFLSLPEQLRMDISHEVNISPLRQVLDK